MRILVVALNTDEITAEIMTFAHEHGIVLGSHQHIIYLDHYSAWSITCEPSAAVSWLLMRYTDHVVVY